MRYLTTILIVCALAGASAGKPPAEAPVAVKTAELVRGNNSMGVEMLSYLAFAQPGENVFISPTSIAVALGMTAAGAAGTTWTAMADALDVEGLGQEELTASNAALLTGLVSADPKVRLNIANSLWLRKGVRLQRDFVGAVGASYGAQVTNLDFAKPAAVKTINDWASRKTNGRIPSIISQLRPDEILVLVNAVYFKAAWQEPFKKDRTAPRDFYLPSGQAVQRQLMRSSDDFRYKAGDGMQAVALPYGDGRMSMYVFLPDKRDGLPAMFASMYRRENRDGWFDGFRTREGEVMLPRFRIEFGTSLVQGLKLLGMGEAFSPRADFSRMVVPPASAAISDVIHKTFVEVNEEGTEAAAVTAVKMLATAMPNRDEPFRFVCDHPFLCAIRDDETGAVLFLGLINDPKQ